MRVLVSTQTEVWKLQFLVILQEKPPVVFGLFDLSPGFAVTQVGFSLVNYYWALIKESALQPHLQGCVLNSLRSLKFVPQSLTMNFGR